MTNAAGGVSKNYTYSYDNNGNITAVYLNGVLKASYTYDSLNQLIRENNADANRTYIYIYGEGGNMTDKLTFSYFTGNTPSVNRNFLTSKSTEYPVFIDPSLTIQGSTDVQDVTIINNQSSLPNSNSLYVGKNSSGNNMRVLMKFPNLTNIGINAENIISAEVSLRDLMCQSSMMEILCCEGTSNWSLSSAVWSNGTPGTNMKKSHKVMYSIGAKLSPIHRYSYDITYLTKEWLKSSSTLNKGLVFKATDDFELNGNSGVYKTFSSANNAQYQDYYPRLEIVYTSYLPDGVYLMRGVSANKYLKAGEIRAENVDTATLTSVNEKNEYDGKQLWYIKRNTSNNLYTITTLGLKHTPSYGESNFKISQSSVYALLDLFLYYNWNISYTISNGKFNCQLTNSHFGDYLSMSSSGNVYCLSTDIYSHWELERIETYRFADFWEGSYQTGVYGNKVYVKYQLDPSIATSNFFQNCDFSIVKSAWENECENLIIYGPEDTVPNGITPFIVTFIAFHGKYYGPINNTPHIWGKLFVNGIDQPNNLVLGDDWQSATIALNDNPEENYTFHGELIETPLSPFYGLPEAPFTREFNATVIHEMGHALKLSHLYYTANTNEPTHTFLNARDRILQTTIAQSGIYLSVMDAEIVFQYYDKMNLISKWKYHGNCRD